MDTPAISADEQLDQWWDAQVAEAQEWAAKEFRHRCPTNQTPFPLCEARDDDEAQHE